MAETRIPNLFIIGAPKCGTTSLSHYLAQHPSIYMSETYGVKEPQFFNNDMELSHIPGIVRDWKEYKNIFSEATHFHRYLGDASALYLFSNNAVKNILKTCEAAKFIVMIRNPIEIAHSLHNQHVKQHLDVINFEMAWRLQSRRLLGKSLPAEFTTGTLLQYGPIAKLGEQIQRLFERVDRYQVHIVVYDDFKNSPEKCYSKLLAWLGLPDNNNIIFSQLNPSVHYRWPQIEHAMRKFKVIRSSLGLPGGLGIHSTMNKINLIKGRERLYPHFKQELCEYFREDILLLEKILNRNFRTWIS